MESILLCYCLVCNYRFDNNLKRILTMTNHLPMSDLLMSDHRLDNHQQSILLMGDHLPSECFPMVDCLPGDHLTRKIGT